MKCNHCGSQWSVTAEVMAKMTNCPFCGELLQTEEKQNLTTLEGTLRFIISRYGVDSLRNGSRTLAMLGDLSPNLRKERILLGYLIQYDNHIRLLELRQEKPEQQVVVYRKVVQTLQDEQMIAQAAAEEVCLQFLQALDVTLAVEQNLTAPVPQPLQKAPAPPKADTDEQRFEQYLRLANNGDSKAMVQLAMCYAGGKGVDEDVDSAIVWYAKAYKKQDNDSAVLLMELYANKKLDMTDCTNIVKIIREDKTPKQKENLEKWFKEQGFELAHRMIHNPQTAALGFEVMEYCDQLGNTYAHSYLKANKQKKPAPQPTPAPQKQPAPQKVPAPQEKPANQPVKKPGRTMVTDVKLVRNIAIRYGLLDKYLFVGDSDFQRKLPKAVRAYAPVAPGENVLVMEDATVFGSAKEGFVLTNKTLYVKEMLTKKKQCPVKNITSVKVYQADKTSHYIRIQGKTETGEPFQADLTFTSDPNLASQLLKFWVEVLDL